MVNMVNQLLCLWVFYTMYQGWWAGNWWNLGQYAFWFKCLNNLIKVAPLKWLEYTCLHIKDDELWIIWDKLMIHSIFSASGYVVVFTLFWSLQCSFQLSQMHHWDFWRLRFEKGTLWVPTICKFSVHLS